MSTPLTEVLPPPKTICLEAPGWRAEEPNRFYLTATKFVRSLDSRHQGSMLNWVIEDLRAGADFENSLGEQFGKPCEELYQEWLESW